MIPLFPLDFQIFVDLLTGDLLKDWGPFYL